MTTIAILTDRTLNILYGIERYERPIQDRLNGAIDNAIGALTVDTEAMWKRDDIAEFPATDEMVVFVNDASGATDVERAARGSTITAQSDNVVMLKNPTFPQLVVKEQINQVVRTELWPHVWTWHQGTLAVSNVDFMYDLPDFVEEVSLVYQENLDADEKWRPLPTGWWDVERQIDTAVATNSNMLRLHHVFDYDETLYFAGKRRPDPSSAGLTALSDDIAEMVPWAAAAKVLAFRSPQIKNAAARSNRDQEGGLLRDYRGLMAEFLRMRDQYRLQLLGEVREDRRWRPPQRTFARAW